MSFISSRLRLVLGSNDVARKHLLSTAANNKGGDLLINGGEFAWLREELGLQDTNIGVFNGEWAGSTASSEQHITSIWPHNEAPIARTSTCSLDQCSDTVQRSLEAWKLWRKVPAPMRGDIVRQFGNKLREKREPLGKLVTLETGKLLANGISEVQGFIDFCDYAAGISRSLGGRVLPSEDTGQVVMEHWNPVGVVGAITAFNYPVLVNGLTQAMALVCGNTVIWKSAPSACLSSIVVTKLMSEVLHSNGLPGSVCSLVCGGANIGRKLATDDRVGIVSFTGSTKVGQEVSSIVNRRFGRCLLELGGNNAVIVDNTADIDKLMQSFTNGFLLDNGQSCSGTRRLIIHCDIYDEVLERLVQFMRNVTVGNPFDGGVSLGPLTMKEGVVNYQRAIARSVELGGQIVYGGNSISGPGYYVEPTIVTGLPHDADIVHTETFAPILYVLKCSSVEEGVQWNNEVEQGLTSSIFTQSIDKVFQWMGSEGSDCGVSNVNTDTNHVYVHTPFGGDKTTGGSRQGGPDSWMGYMRRTTSVINYNL